MQVMKKTDISSDFSSSNGQLIYSDDGLKLKRSVPCTNFGNITISIKFVNLVNAI